jgi:glyoxylase-like metal-dependent hydrolase (beta-lactamase superfamily II)
VTGDPFERNHDPPIGRPEPLAPGLVVVTAPNAGPMTFTGTRSYLLGTREVAVIDPGPDDPAHLEALVAAVPAGGRVTTILVTHAHLDHSAGARALAERVDAPVIGFGARPRRVVMERISDAGTLGGGEGIDAAFAPDRRLADGEMLAGTGWRLEALHTPGHLGDHLCFAWAEGRALFSGDLIMGWSTTLISPPDGEISAFLESLDRLATRGERVYYPGHGAPIREPRAMLAWQRNHRLEREVQVLAALAAGPARVPDLVAAIYTRLDPALRPAAGRNVLAHLLDLVGRGHVVPEGPLGPDARYRRA